MIRMIKKFLLNEFKQIDDKIMKMINIGLGISLLIGTIGIALILIYNSYSCSYDTFKAGFILIKTSLTFSAQFVACGLGCNKIRKERI